MTGFPDDPSERPTRMADYRAVGTRLDDSDSVPPGVPPAPWYRSRVLLALWVMLVALLVVLMVYGIAELARGGETGGTSTTTSSTSSSRTSTTSPSTTTETSPPPGTPEQTPEEAPPPQQGNNPPGPAEPPHHHRYHIPSTITLPHTVITLPHGF